MSAVLAWLRRARHLWQAMGVARTNRRLIAAQTRVPRPPLPDLALVIPVWNDAEGLARLLQVARDLGCFAQIVVVDDGSDVPVPPAPDVTLIRHATPRGGGVARNAGLDHVTCAHVLFFDADDLITPDLLDLLGDLGACLQDGGSFDFCLFKHADSRVALEPRWGQPDWDEALWARARHAVGTLDQARPEALPVLAQTANYPWNKIYRTGFLRDHGIGCAATAVHQDIPLHWLAFLMARTVLVSDRICAWHAVGLTGARLTNRRGPERLQVFQALDPVARAVAQADDPAWRAALADFTLGLVDWIAARIDPEYLAALRVAEAAFLDRLGPDHTLPEALRSRMMARRAAVLADPIGAVGSPG